MSANPVHAPVELDHARQQFRQAMAHLGAAVNVITTAGPHGRCGITASAVCSVTDAPPTLLVCLNRSSAMHAVFDGNRKVCINVLPASLEGIARHFAGLTGLSMEARSAGESARHDRRSEGGRFARRHVRRNDRDQGT
jgi:flavin reductase (NADH)